MINKQKVIKAVFFDIYGTIADFFPPKEEIQINVTEKFNITLVKDKILDAYKLANNFLVKQNSIFPIRKMNDEEKLNFFSKYEKIIIDNGGKVTGSISKHTTALILGTKPGSKLVKAKNLNVKIIKEDEFSKIL